MAGSCDELAARMQGHAKDGTRQDTHGIQLREQGTAHRIAALPCLAYTELLQLLITPQPAVPPA